MSEKIRVGLLDASIECPRCKAVHDAYSEFTEEGERPATDDTIVCFDCGALNVLQADGSLITMTPEEEASFLSDSPELKRIVDRLKVGL